MMTKRIEVLSEARSWIGTPYHHQARLKGHGVDCAQLVIGVGQNLGLIPSYPNRYMNYGRIPRPDFMRARLIEFMDQISFEESKPGDILWMGWRKGLPMHLGIITDHNGRGIIHSFFQAGKVVETVLTLDFEILADSYWRYRGITDE